MKLRVKMWLKPDGEPGKRSLRAIAHQYYLDQLKMAAAEELGLLEKAKRFGWGQLSSAESGRIGGYMTKMMRDSSKRQRSV